MSKTRHINQRLDQRSIKHSMMNLIKAFGVADGDKVIFNRQGIGATIKELQKTLKEMHKMQSRGGLVLVEADDMEITCYPLESYARSRRI